MTDRTGISSTAKPNWRLLQNSRSGFRQKAAPFNFLKFAALFRDAATSDWRRPVIFAVVLLAGPALAADTNLTWKADVDAEGNLRQ